MNDNTRKTAETAFILACMASALSLAAFTLAIVL